MRKVGLVLVLPAFALGACSAVGDVVGQSAGAVSVATDVAAACTTAAAAWAPGVSPEQARQAIDDAVSAVELALASGPEIPGIAAVQSALDGAQQSLALHPGSSSLGVSQKTLEVACAAFQIVN